MKTPTTLAIRPFPEKLRRELKIAAIKERKPLCAFITALLADALRRKAAGK